MRTPLDQDFTEMYHGFCAIMNNILPLCKIQSIRQGEFQSAIYKEAETSEDTERLQQDFLVGVYYS